MITAYFHLIIILFFFLFKHFSEIISQYFLIYFLNFKYWILIQKFTITFKKFNYLIQCSTLQNKFYLFEVRKLNFYKFLHFLIVHLIFLFFLIIINKIILKVKAFLHLILLIKYQNILLLIKLIVINFIFPFHYFYYFLKFIIFVKIAKSHNRCHQFLIILKFSIVITEVPLNLIIIDLLNS